MQTDLLTTLQKDALSYILEFLSFSNLAVLCTICKRLGSVVKDTMLKRAILWPTPDQARRIRKKLTNFEDLNPYACWLKYDFLEDFWNSLSCPYKFHHCWKMTCNLKVYYDDRFGVHTITKPPGANIPQAYKITVKFPKELAEDDSCWKVNISDCLPWLESQWKPRM